MRGCLTPQIQREAQKFLRYEMTTKELRLLPYIDYCLKNRFDFDPRRISQEEFAILDKWQSEGYLMYSRHRGINVKRRFYNFIQRVLWLGYVEGKLK